MYETMSTNFHCDQVYSEAIPFDFIYQVGIFNLFMKLGIFKITFKTLSAPQEWQDHCTLPSLVAGRCKADMLENGIGLQGQLSPACYLYLALVF